MTQHNHHHRSPQAQPIFHHRPSTTTGTTTTTTTGAATKAAAATMIAIAATSTRSSTTGRDNGRKIVVEGDSATNPNSKQSTSSSHNRSHNRSRHNLIDKTKTTSSNNTNLANQGSAMIQSSEMRRPTSSNNIFSHDERMEIRSSQRVNDRKHPHPPSHDNAAVADEDGSDSSHAAMIDNHQAAAAVAVAVADYDSNDYNESDTNDEDAGLQGYEIVIPNSRSGSINGGGDNGTDGNTTAAAVVIPSRSNNGLNKDNYRHHRHRRSSRDRATKHASSSENKKEPSQQNDELSQQQLPPGYVYALREIITCNDPGAAEEEEEEEKAEEKKEESSMLLPDDNDDNRKGRNSSITHPPRMITSQIVRTTESVYHQLEETTTGTVLCRPSIGEGYSKSRLDAGNSSHFYASSDLNLESSSSSSLGDDGNTTTTKQQHSLFIAAVSASYIQTKMMEGQGRKTNCPVIACAEEEGHGMANDNSSDQSSETPKRRKKWRRFPGKLYGSMKKCLVRTRKKKKNASRPAAITENTKSRQRGLFDDNENTLPIKSKKSATSQYHPKMIINNGNIDWDHSRVDDCGIISQTSSFITYSTAKSNSSASLKNNGGGRSSSSSHSKTSPNINSSSLGATIFGDEAVIHNRIQPINEIVCVDKSLGIYISESGLSASDCQNIINVSEFCASMRGGWSSYTYAKQTLGCRENDQLAFVCARPVMTACATIRKHLMMNGVSDIIGEDKIDDGLLNGDNVAPGELSTTNNKSCKGGRNNSVCDGGNSVGPSNSRPSCRKKELVLDVREPHVVKYDTSKMERQKLDMHTDKSEWTFLIALSEGRGENYGGGGTYFQALNSTIHLQRGQMLIFRGKLRHCGVRIVNGTRYLLVGFLVPHVKTPALKGGARI